MLNSIRNAQAVQKPTVTFPYSNLKYEILKVMEKEGFVEKIEKKGKKIKTLEINLKYQDKIPVISGLKVVSKPGQRIYINHKNIKPIRNGYGVAIISTSKGILTNKEAKKQGLGGEVIALIW